MIEAPSAFSRSPAHSDDMDYPVNQPTPDPTVDRGNSSEPMKAGPPETAPTEPPPMHPPPSNLHPMQEGAGMSPPTGIPHDPDKP